MKLLSWGHMAAKTEPTGSSMHFFTCDAPTVPPPALESPGHGEELPATPGKWTWGPRGCTMGPKHSRPEARPLPTGSWGLQALPSFQVISYCSSQLWFPKPGAWGRGQTPRCTDTRCTVSLGRHWLSFPPQMAMCTAPRPGPGTGTPLGF